MTTTQFPTAEERRSIARAGAHALPPHLLTEENRFAGDVTDLDMARVLRALEEGVQFRRNAHGRWFGPPGYPKGFKVSSVIAEGVRTGLIHDAISRKGREVVHVLVPAPVHLGAWNHETASWEPVCRLAGHGKGPMRTRVHRDANVADCPRCFDRL